MGAWPVIVRELSAEARRPANYWLRVSGALLAVVLISTLSGQISGLTITGARMFSFLTAASLLIIWVGGPLLTADCISAERREGTLGLLFLTPLTPEGVVAGKSIAHALRGLLLLFSSIPVAAICFVLGGVAWIDFVTVLSLLVAALCVALSAGLLASVHTQSHVRAIILAEICATLFLVVFLLGTSFLTNAFLTGLIPPAAAPVPTPMTGIVPGLPAMPSAQAVMAARYMSSTTATAFRPVVFPTGSPFPWATLASAPPYIRQLWLVGVALIVVSAVAFLRSSVWLAARQVYKLRRSEPPSARQLWWTKTFCTPMFLTGIFRRRMRRALNRNPISWLQQYSWNARITKWGWSSLILLSQASLFFDESFQTFMSIQPYVIGALGSGMAFSAVTSFRQEKQSGALELLLVTPIRENQLIMGRVKGLWAQFLPAFLLWSTVYYTMLLTTSRYDDNLPHFSYMLLERFNK